MPNPPKSASGKPAKRLCVTVTPEMVKKLDGYVKANRTNRSHEVEQSIKRRRKA